MNSSKDMYRHVRQIRGKQKSNLVRVHLGGSAGKIIKAVASHIASRYKLKTWQAESVVMMHVLDGLKGGAK